LQQFARWYPVHPSIRAISGLNTEPQAQAILLVDNSRMFSGMVAATIHERLGLPVTVTASLAEAREALAKDPGRYFLVFTGLVLSDADPDSVLAFFVDSGLPMVVVSGVYDESIRQKVLSKPVVDCVLKNTPGSIDYLVWLAQRLDRNRRIGALVVDDSASARTLASTMLRLYGFNVMEAASGEEALRAVAANPWIRLVIADYEMPGMDGLELIRRLRATCTRDRMSIIGISGAEAPSLVARFLKHGANDFLHKPYSREEFFCRVSQNVDNLDLIGTLQDLATKDFLTGLPNRRHFFDQGGRIFRTERAANVATGMLDIDHFKHINDTYGHEAGDLAIKAVANAVAQHVGSRDLPSRFGGEEFAIVAVGLSDERVRAYFEQLRADIAAMVIALPDGRNVRLTVSIGVCTSGDSLSGMLAEADRQLYVAKAGGRNRVEHAMPSCLEALSA
jgi:diguanylate cyclase (GGDEF)-like protein